MSSIGLSSAQASSCLVEAIENRSSEFQGLLEAVAAGEAPEYADRLSRTEHIRREDLAVIFTLLNAIGDLIEANNAELAKQIPHVNC